MSYAHGNSTIVTSAVTTEAVVAVVSSDNFGAADPSFTGVRVRADLNVTQSATGNTVTYKIRQGNGITGTTVFTGTAIPFLTGVLTQSHTVSVVDTSAIALAGNPLTYSLTATSSAGTTTVNSVTIEATAVNALG